MFTGGTGFDPWPNPKDVFFQRVPSEGTSYFEISGINIVGILRLTKVRTNIEHYTFGLGNSWGR